MQSVMVLRVSAYYCNGCCTYIDIYTKDSHEELFGVAVCLCLVYCHFKYNDSVALFLCLSRQLMYMRS